MAYEKETTLFRRWYVTPIEKLKELPNGDGGFVVLIVALPLYERLIMALLKCDGKPTNPDDDRAAMNNDLQMNDQQRKKFWAIFRVGFMHQAMGQAGTTSWLVSHEFNAKPEFRNIAGVETLCLDPWKFADRILRQFLERPELISASESFPLAEIFYGLSVE